MKYPLLLMIAVAACTTGARAQTPFLSDPTPVRVDSGTSLTFTKELNAYPNYGTDGAADILYTGNTGTWTFALTSDDLNRFNTATFTIVMTLDDHYSVPVNSYSFTAAINGGAAPIGSIMLAHGAPFNTVFTNWMPVSLDAPSLVAGVNTLRLNNTSTAGNIDWIAADRISLSLSASATAPEPSTFALLILPTLGALVARRRKNH